MLFFHVTHHIFLMSFNRYVHRSTKRQQVDGRPDAEQSHACSMAQVPQSVASQIPSQPNVQQEVLLGQPADAGAIPKRPLIAAEKTPALVSTGPF